MNTIESNELKDNKKDIYLSLWDNKKFDFNIVKTGNTNPSYEFAFCGKSLEEFIGESIADNFGIQEIEERKVFMEKFRQTCSGSGDELRKITTLHSSSLCALLCFFNVTEQNYLTISIPDYGEYKFTDSYFEFKNKVIKSPSNMDIVLVGTNTKNNNKVVLFLESKFSEYVLSVGMYKDIGKSYYKKGCFSAPIYEALENNKTFDFSEKNGFENKDIYNEGLKQIISHYYGIRNFLKGKPYKKGYEMFNKIHDQINAQEILLGEIIFEFTKINERYLESYKEKYSELAKIINKKYNQDFNNDKKDFKVIKQLLTYSSIIDKNSTYKLPPKVRDFYFGGRN